jgi:hypothetical protein
VRRRNILRKTALVALAAALCAVLVLGLATAGAGRAKQPCTHGISSIGPVYFKDGRFAGGDTTPHTEACLP